jgi:hypothetical protein
MEAAHCIKISMAQAVGKKSLIFTLGDCEAELSPNILLYGINSKRVLK